MTNSQLEEFWREWQALKTKWGVEVEGIGDGLVMATFPDGSSIARINESRTQLTPVDDIARRTAVTGWGRE